MPLLPVYDLLDTSMRQDPILFPPPEDLKKMELIQDLQGDIQLYYKAWNRVKIGICRNFFRLGPEVKTCPPSSVSS